MDCDIHDWNWDMYDEMGCPICYGINEERERIIALLEQHQCTFTDTEIMGCWCGSFNDAIALIKGENE